MSLVWSSACIPPASNATLDGGHAQCCSARFTFSVSGVVPSGEGGGTYYPNKCTATPTTSTVTIGPMVVGMEVISDGIFVDDELLVNGSIYEANNFIGTLNSGTNAANGELYDGGSSNCNIAHTVESGKVLATVGQGQTVTLAGGDNHGIDLIMNGAIIVKPIGSP